MCCPPGGENAVIVYTTKTGNKKDIEDSKQINFILKLEKIEFTVRDISADSGYRNELKEVLGKKDIKVPVVFVKGRLIGGAAEVDKMDKEGKLEILFHGIPKFYDELPRFYTVKEEDSSA
ncbi:Glutaredoxin-related protein [Thalictrum thalictroides]|uniref:Glutaredoxin-related protein n=1 Tax=Thalictrum thalictroides TaxID=46969 RepID=A0A7J6V6U3_THATH|nr:Glutaredoxin-related protein [Thalictrum thalictroides]